MTDKAVSRLRRRMIEDMTVRGFTACTQPGYITAVERFAVFLGRAPGQATVEVPRRFQIHMRSEAASAATTNTAVSALRFFFRVTLERGDAEVGMTTVRMTHHPHLHMIVPGGGIALDGGRWISCRPGFFLPVRVLSRLFRRLFLEKLAAAHDAGKLRFFGTHARLVEPAAFTAYLAPLRYSATVDETGATPGVDDGHIDADGAAPDTHLLND